MDGTETEERCRALRSTASRPHADIRFAAIVCLYCCVQQPKMKYDPTILACAAPAVAILYHILNIKPTSTFDSPQQTNERPTEQQAIPTNERANCKSALKSKKLATAAQGVQRKFMANSNYASRTLPCLWAPVVVVATINISNGERSEFAEEDGVGVASGLEWCYWMVPAVL